MTYTLTNGNANDDYDVTLWEAAGCNQIFDAGTLSTNASGQGTLTFTTSTAGFRSFFATGQSAADNHYNDSLIFPTTITPKKVASIPQLNNLFLCYSKFESDPGVWGSDTAALLLTQGYWLPYAVAGNVDGATNVGDVHLVCNLSGTQKPSGAFVDDEGTTWSSDYAAMPGLYPIAG